MRWNIWLTTAEVPTATPASAPPSAVPSAGGASGEITAPGGFPIPVRDMFGPLGPHQPRDDYIHRSSIDPSPPHVDIPVSRPPRSHYRSAATPTRLPRDQETLQRLAAPPSSEPEEPEAPETVAKGTDASPDLDEDVGPDPGAIDEPETPDKAERLHEPEAIDEPIGPSEPVDGPELAGAVEVSRPSEPSEACALTAFTDRVVEEGVWKGVAAVADTVHPGGGTVVRLAYQAVKVLRALGGINSGRGFDLSIGVLDTGIGGLCIGFRIREFGANDGPLPKAGIGLDVSFIDPLTVGQVDGDGADRPQPPAEVSLAGRWYDYLGPLAGADPALVLEKARILSAGEAMKLLDSVQPSQRPLALSLAIEADLRSGRYAYENNGASRRGRWPQNG